MDFRYKCLMQTIFSIFPNSEDLNYFAQKYISRKLPPSRNTYETKLKQALAHHDTFEKYGSNNDSIVYEIGCGWHLAMALIFSTLGYTCIKALDITNHVRIELVNTILGYLRDDKLISQDFARFSASCDIKEKLLNEYRIALMAPCDSRKTGLKDSSVDFIYSQEVFEHIPPNFFPQIMTECYRVLKNDGIISLNIDYTDHYCSVDKSITPYNFLKYTDKKWKAYNPDLHYVNRLRHIDFKRIFERTGFEIINEIVFRPDNWNEIVTKDFISDEFTSKYTLDELSITSARIVLKKRM